MKKKGFTLIELLAVIVILAIIALIAVPTVLNIIERAREGAAKSSATSYIKAVETYIVTSKLDKKLEQLEAGETYTTTKLNNLVELKGTKPSEGSIVISNKNSVASATLTINNYVIIYDGEEYTIQGKETEPEYDLLSDVISVGDYVAYDAGSWTETVAKPSSQGNFGGYTAGQNKANSVSWCYNSNMTTELKGWRVLSVSGETVALVHAGHPECYYHASGYSEESLENLSNRAISEYLNSEYADSSHMMTYDEALNITGGEDVTTNDLRYIGVAGTNKNSGIYWLQTKYDLYNLYYMKENAMISYGNNNSVGIRPVIVLKSGIKTAGKGTDAVGQEAWTLVKP